MGSCVSAFRSKPRNLCRCLSVIRDRYSSDKIAACRVSAPLRSAERRPLRSPPNKIPPRPSWLGEPGNALSSFTAFKILRCRYSGNKMRATLFVSVSRMAKISCRRATAIKYRSLTPAKSATSKMGTLALLLA